MNSENRHPNDALIDNELEGLRSVAFNDNARAKAVLAMRTHPTGSATKRWSIGMGTAIAVAVLIATPFVTQQASAAEIHKIAAAQRGATTRFCKSFQRGPDGNLIHSYDEWIDGGKHTQKFYNAFGRVSGIASFDGKLSSLYYAKSGGVLKSDHVSSFNTDAQPLEAIIDDVPLSTIPIETVEDYMNIPVLKSFTRQEGVTLNGKSYDLYAFGKTGAYKLWIDTQTHLPVQREVYGRDGIIERDLYEYPAAISPSAFATPSIEGVQFFDFPRARKDLAGKLAKPGEVQQFGGASVEFKGMVLGNHSFAILWKGQLPTGDAYRSVAAQVPGFGAVMGRRGFVDENGEKYEAVEIFFAKTPRMPLKVSIPVVDAKGELVGIAKFTANPLIFAPDTSRLLWRPDEGERTAVNGKG